jgi:hypothetical protein
MLEESRLTIKLTLNEQSKIINNAKFDSILYEDVSTSSLILFKTIIIITKFKIIKDYMFYEFMLKEKTCFIIFKIFEVIEKIKNKLIGKHYSII